MKNINLLTYALYYYDKRQAQVNRWRISEKTLLTFALFCGWPAALYAVNHLRHKSSKKSFLIALWVVAMLNLVGLIYFYFFS